MFSLVNIPFRFQSWDLDQNQNLTESGLMRIWKDPWMQLEMACLMEKPHSSFIFQRQLCMTEAKARWKRGGKNGPKPYLGEEIEHALAKWLKKWHCWGMAEQGSRFTAQLKQCWMPKEGLSLFFIIIDLEGNGCIAF